MVEKTMGITIHYEITFRGSRELLKAKLDKAIEQFIEAGAKPTRLIEFTFPECGHVVDDTMIARVLCDKYPDINVSHGFEGMRWYLIQQMPFGKDPIPHESMGFSTLIMNGCEPMNISFLNTKGRAEAWHARSFCKTQYAMDFEKAHLLVCKLLRILESLEFKVDVNDEADYYNSGDLVALQHDKGMMDAFIGSFGRHLASSGLGDVVRGDGTVLKATVNQADSYSGSGGASGNKAKPTAKKPRSTKVVPLLEHACCMADLCCTCGNKLTKEENVLREKPKKVDVNTLHKICNKCYSSI
jgi:hypothetical protein